MREPMEAVDAKDHDGYMPYEAWLEAENAREDGIRIVKCVECGRIFELLDPRDAEEWAYGHDCEGE